MNVDIKLDNLKISAHCLFNNKFRNDAINTIVSGNWGQIIKQEWYKGAYRCLTDTGLIFIVSPEKDKILTYYLARGSTAQGMFGNKAPSYLLKKISKNASKYTQLFEEKLTDSKLHEYKVKGIYYGR
jgi:hypothetical protein